MAGLTEELQELEIEELGCGSALYAMNVILCCSCSSSRVGGGK